MGRFGARQFMNVGQQQEKFFLVSLRHADGREFRPGLLQNCLVCGVMILAGQDVIQMKLDIPGMEMDASGMEMPANMGMDERCNALQH